MICAWGARIAAASDRPPRQFIGKCETESSGMEFDL
jgi:hypothetical protein